MKRKLKKKNCFIALAILLIIVIEVVNPFKVYSSYKIQKLNYSKKSSKKIFEYGLKDKILNDKYSEFIDVALESNDFKKENYDVYKNIEYYDLHDVSLINKLIEKGYNVKDINCILKVGTKSSVEEFLGKEKYEGISNFLQYDYAHLENIDRYIEYQKRTISNYDEAIIYVESGLDKEYYTDYRIVDKFDYLMLVNKYNYVNEDYIPDNLIKVESAYSVGSTYGNKVMLDNFYEMAKNMQTEIGLSILVRGGYRSYQEQEKTYEEYLKLYDQKYVNNYVARPGFSEHQTGLAVDIKASSSNTFQGTKEASWLKENAYKYGFILRYTKQTEDLTGYRDEVWHYRYVGKEVAKYIFEKKITFEEYWVKFLNK